jgi:hypothetical protein
MTLKLSISEAKRLVLLVRVTFRHGQNADMGVTK